MEDSYILFKISNADYAVQIDSIQQIEMIDQITRVPNAPDFVEGVVYLRGKVVPVINLRSRFHMEKIPYTLQARLIIIQQDSRTVALAVDSAKEFAKISAEHITPPPETLIGPGVEYLKGVATLGDRLVLVMDLHQLLSKEERTTLSESTLEG